MIGSYQENIVQVDEDLDPLLPEVCNDWHQYLGKDPRSHGQTKEQSLEIIGLSLQVKPQVLVVTGMYQYLNIHVLEVKTIYSH